MGRLKRNGGNGELTSSNLRETVAAGLERYARDWDLRDPDNAVGMGDWARQDAADWRSDKTMRVQMANLPRKVHLLFGRRDLEHVWSGEWRTVEVDAVGRVRRPGDDVWLTVT